MIRVYDDAEKKFNNNGIKVLHPLYAEITKVKDGDYYLEIEDVIDNFEYYQKGMLIMVPTPWGDQGFRCDNPRMENNRVSCKAWHLFYDSKNYVIGGSIKRYEKNCDKVIKEYKNMVDGAGNCPFSDSKIATISSDIESEEEKETEIEDISLYDAIEYLRGVYSGTLVRDNFNIAINKSIGEDRGVVLAYNKNITDMKVEENWDDVCTKILPYTMVKDTKITLKAYTTTTPFLKLEDIGEQNPYGIQYTKIVEFKYEEKIDGDPTTDDYNKAREWLRVKAQEYLIANKYPKANYKVSAYIDNVSDVGDTIYIKHPKIILDGEHLKATVISVKYDAISKRYTNIEFGNYRRGIKDLQSSIISAVVNSVKTVSSSGDNSFQEQIDEFNASLTKLLSEGNVIYDGSQILVVDALPKENALNCIKINSAGVSHSANGINGTFAKVIGIDGTIATSGSNSGVGAESVVLYEGIGSSTNVRLTPPIKDNTTFKYIEIFYSLSAVGYDSATSDFHQSVKVSAPYGKKISLLSSTIDENGNIIIGVGVVKINYDSENDISKIVFETNANKSYNGSNMGTAMTPTSSENKVYIRKVVGYKA